MQNIVERKPFENFDLCLCGEIVGAKCHDPAFFNTDNQDYHAPQVEICERCNSNIWIEISEYQEKSENCACGYSYRALA